MLDFRKSETGSSAAEFALVLPVVLLFVFGLVEFGMLLFTTTQLHWTVEQASRCSSVSTDCRENSAVNGSVTNTTVITYANGIYRGLAPANFTYDNSGTCNLLGSGNSAVNSGHRVTGIARFTVNLGVYYREVPVVANACFP